ncbi:hypothetical protein Tco_0974158 [Tanacetum coccineum]|uniref:Flocculation protein FLO11-like n=1 Tax=Tanacetum coccineum TaxID=301880 RepID=A0ABQ5EAT1_9ASTR
MMATPNKAWQVTVTGSRLLLVAGPLFLQFLVRWPTLLQILHLTVQEYALLPDPLASGYVIKWLPSRVEVLAGGNYCLPTKYFEAIPPKKTSIKLLRILAPLVAPKVGAVPVILPTRVLDLVDYSSSSDSNPLEDSLHVAPELPLVSPFLCTDDSKADSESEPAEQRPKRHGSLTPSSEFPHAPVVAPPGIRRRPTILRVGPYLARRLAWRRVSHHSSDRHSSLDFTSDSSSSSSSSDSLSDISSGSSSDSLSDTSSVHSSGCDASGQSHSGPSTRVASPRLVDPPVRTP